MNQTRTKSLTPSIIDFPKIWWKTLSDIKIYRSLIHLPSWFAFFYTFLLYGVLALASTAIFQFRTLPQWNTTFEQSWNELHTHWSEDTTVIYNGQQLSIEGFDQPQLITYPENITVPESFPPYLAYVETTTNKNIFSEQERPALLGITSEHLVIQPNNSSEISESNANTWTEALGTDSFTITKSDLESNSEDILSGSQQAFQLMVIPYFFWAWFGVWLARIGFLVLYAFFAQTLFWMFGTKIRYQAILRFGLYVLPVVELIPLLWKAIYGTTFMPGTFWWLWMGAFAFLAWYNRKGKILQL